MFGGYVLRIFPVEIKRLFSLFDSGLSDAIKPWSFPALQSRWQRAQPRPCYSNMSPIVHPQLVVYFWFTGSFVPGALQSAQTSVLWSFLDISEVAENERWMSAMMWSFALFPRATDRRLPSPDAAPESPEAGWCERVFPASWQLNFPSVPAVPSPTFTPEVQIYREVVWASHTYSYFLAIRSLVAALPTSHRETAALYLSVSAHTPRCLQPSADQEGQPGAPNHPIILPDDMVTDLTVTNNDLIYHDADKLFIDHGFLSLKRFSLLFD